MPANRQQSWNVRFGSEADPRSGGADVRHAGLTVFVLLEKIAPVGRAVSRTAGVGLMVWGAWLLIR